MGFTEAEEDNGVTLTNDEQAILNAINSERVSRGLPIVKVAQNLEDLARNRSKQLVSNFNHPANISSQIKDMGYNGYYKSDGENISAGLKGAAVLNNPEAGWVNSETPLGGHRIRIFDPNVQYIGIGVYNDPNSQYKTYAAADFGSVKSVDPSYFNTGLQNGQNYTGPDAITPVPSQQQQLNVANQQLQNDQQKVADLQKQIEADKQQIQKDTPTALQNQLKDAQTKLANDQQTLTNLQNELTKAQQALTTDTNALKNAQASVKDAQTKLDNAKEMSAKAQTALNNANNNLAMQQTVLIKHNK